MDKQIEEVFKKYAGDMSEMDEAGMDWFHFTEAIRNGDLFTKADVERARIESELGMAIAVLSDIKDIISDKLAELETKLKELK